MSTKFRLRIERDKGNEFLGIWTDRRGALEQYNAIREARRLFIKGREVQDFEYVDPSGLPSAISVAGIVGYWVQYADFPLA